MIDPDNDTAFDADPLVRLQHWYHLAVKAGEPQPEAVTLATSSLQGQPYARIVLFRGISDNGLRFFTNYNSAKGQQMADNPRVSMLFFWPSCFRQIRVEGTVSKLPGAESDEYFQQRPRGHQINAHASQQSTAIESRDVLEAARVKIEQMYEGRPVPRPEHWGGYRLTPQRWEFWIGRNDRFHDRWEYQSVNGLWQVRRLSP